LGVSGRLHAVWVFARACDRKSLFEIAEHDLAVRVRAQAVRAIADLCDPIFVEHKIEAGRGDPEIAKRLTMLCRDQEPRILLEVTSALGRLRWSQAPGWLKENIGTPDPTLAHAAMQTMRRSRNWPAVLEWLDAPNDSPLRLIVLRALGEQADVEVVDGLLHLLENSRAPAWRREYAELLSRVYRKPGP